MSAPQISFVVPYFASHSRLGACRASVHEHCSLGHEVIIVDDGNIAGKKAVADGDNMRVIALEENRGPGYCRNRGIEAAQAEWIFFLDSDDLLLGDPAAYLIAAGDARPDIITGVLGSDRLFPILARDLPRTTNLGKEIALAKLAFFTAHLYRRDFLIGSGARFAEDIRNAEDTVFLMRALAAAEAVLLTETSVYGYDQRHDSLSKSTADDKVAGFTERFGTAAGAVADALSAYPSAQAVKASMTFKYGLKALAGLAAHDQPAALEAAHVLADFASRLQLRSAEARAARKAANVYWDDRHRACAGMCEAGDLPQLIANLRAAPIRIS